MKTSTFFSYKGGAGRSTTCYNTIPFLAEEVGACKSRPIILLDMDIESAGMTYLLNKEKIFSGNKFDVKELLKNENQINTTRCSISEHSLYKEMVPVGHDLGLEDDYAVMFLGVNDTTPQLNRNEISGSAQQALLNLIDFADNNLFGAVVMDSAAGDQFSANIAQQVTDNIVFCMKMTRQFRTGTFNYLHKFATNNPMLAANVNIILLPTVVPNDTVIDGKSQLQTSIDDIRAKLNNLLSKVKVNITTDFVSDSDHFGINEVVRFKWQEGVLYQIQNQTALLEDEQKALRQYKTLARILGE